MSIRSRKRRHRNRTTDPLSVQENRTGRWNPWYHWHTFDTTGLSGLFPGPVCGRGRPWNWNPNSRRAAIQRWYAGTTFFGWDDVRPVRGLRGWLP